MHLRVGALLTKQATNSSDNVFYPIDAQFIKLLSFALGFGYELTYDPNKEMGTPLANGSWTGLIGMANRSEIDFAVTPMSVTERLDAAGWSYPYTLVPVTFITRNPTYKTEWLSYLKPFSHDIWMCLIASIVVVTAAFYVASYGRYEFQRILLSAYAAVLQNTITVEPASTSECFLTIGWLAGVTFTIFCYTALLLSFMTVPTLSGVRTIPDLSREVTRGTYQCITVPGAFLIQTLKMSSNPDVAIIGDDLEQNKKSTDILGILKEKASKIPAFVVSKNPLKPLEENYFVSEDVFFNMPLTMPVKKDFCCKKELDRAIHYITAAGLYSKIVNDVNFKTKLGLRASSEPQDTGSLRILTVSDFKGAFAFLVMGNTFSMLVLVLEKLSVIFSRKAPTKDIQL